jgi:hypothetical protein
MGRKEIIVFFFILSVLLIMILCQGCIKPEYRPTVWEKNLPAECNMALNTYKLFYDSKDKSGTVPPSEYCYKVIQRNDCRAEIFGVKPDGSPASVDYENSKLYRAYTQCLSEKR